MASLVLSEMPLLVRQYALYLRNIRGLSVKTVDEYCLDLRTFFRFLQKQRQQLNEPIEEILIAQIDLDFIKKITTYEVFEFMNYVSDDRNNLSATRQRKSSSIKSFFKYLVVHEKLLEENPVENLSAPKKKKVLPHFLSLEQSIELLNSVEGPDKERDYCMLVLFLNCGLRLSELVSINLSDVYHQNSTIKILGKGNKERIIYLNEACLQAVDSYIKVRPKNAVVDRNALFLSSRKQRISPKTVQFIVKKYLKKIGLGGTGYSVHKLRHTAATLMYRYGNVDIRVLQDILGHENLGTTEIYTHTSSTQVESAMNANPLAQMTTNKKSK
ncbi:tyrosine recombinase XerC [Scatolibacter rhodanostii]|uniref:tyrosine recombinase XerC n=1 Tax=Scatolibacter rhodanostii TaxID=2014781 RepID=UPI000C085334|nr:tyrosine recombinase XerC [Scatolibacter rhodanostii]